MKATKNWPNFPFFLMSDYKLKMGQTFVAFSEYLNLNNVSKVKVFPAFGKAFMTQNEEIAEICCKKGLDHFGCG